MHLSEPGDCRASERCDTGLFSFTARYRGRTNQSQSGRQGMAPAPPVTGVGNLGQDFY